MVYINKPVIGLVNHSRIVEIRTQRNVSGFCVVINCDWSGVHRGYIGGLIGMLPCARTSCSEHVVQHVCRTINKSTASHVTYRFSAMTG